MSAGAKHLRRLMGPASTRSFPLWFGVLGPPLAWASHLLLGDGLFELGCSPGFVRKEIYGLPFQFWALLQTALFLGIDVLAGLLALWAYRALGRSQAQDETRHGRARGMAVAGMASSAVYGLVLIYGLLSVLYLRGCGVSP
jgi:hypothetical protein